MTVDKAVGGGYTHTSLGESLFLGSTYKANFLSKTILSCF